MMEGSSGWAKVGLALGGGAARGLAHVGVLRVLARAQVPVHILTGTSMGAIIGGTFAATLDPDEVERRIREVLSSPAFRRMRLSFLKEAREERQRFWNGVTELVRRAMFYGVSAVRQSFVRAEEFAQNMAAILPDVRIEDLPLSFAAVALDLNAGQEVVFRTGSLRQAAAASAAIPGVLPPVRMNGRLLIDGGWVDKIPVLPAYRLGADLVIAVDISPTLPSQGEYTRGMDVLFRANAIKDSVLGSFARRLADVVLEPSVGDVHWADFGAADHCIAAGERAATLALPRIQELLRQERWKALVRARRGKRIARLYLDAPDARFVVE